MIRKFLVIMLCFVAGLSFGLQARAADYDDKDVTPVTGCSGLPPTVSIPVFSWTETDQMCREMARILEGIRRKDITNFEKAVFVLRHGGYRKGDDSTAIARDLIEIIRLRGLYNKPDRWHDTTELIVKSWNAFNGAVGPKQVIAFLKGAGPQAAKGLSDEGLTNMIILIKIQHQQGDD